MTEATRFPYSPANFAEYLDAHDEFHRVGYHGPNKGNTVRSEAETYKITVIKNGDKLYASEYSTDIDGYTFKDGIYEPMTTGLEGPPDEVGNDFEGRATNE